MISVVSSLNVYYVEIDAAAGTIYESESNNTKSTADRTYDDYDNSQEIVKCHVRPGVSYYVRITWDNNYSSSSYYKFRVKRYDLLPAIAYTTEYTVTNVIQQEIVQSSRTRIDETLASLESMGYDSAERLRKAPNSGYNDLQNAKIISFGNHGEPGRMHFNVNQSSTGRSIYANYCSDLPVMSRALQNLPNHSLDNARCVIYAGCYTGLEHNTYGSLVDMTLDKGASFAIGWNQMIALEDPNLRSLV